MSEQELLDWLPKQDRKTLLAVNRMAGINDCKCQPSKVCECGCRVMQRDWYLPYRALQRVLELLWPDLYREPSQDPYPLIELRTDAKSVSMAERRSLGYALHNPDDWLQRGFNPIGAFRVTASTDRQGHSTLGPLVLENEPVACLDVTLSYREPRKFHESIDCPG